MLVAGIIIGYILLTAGTLIFMKGAHPLRDDEKPSENSSEKSKDEKIK